MYSFLRSVKKRPLLLSLALAASIFLQVLSLNTAKSEAFTDEITVTTAVIPAASRYDMAMLQLERVGALYNVDISLNAARDPYGASWKAIDVTDEANLAIFADYLSHEWRKYPVGFTSKSGIKHIYIVKDLSVDGQKRTALPDPIRNEAVYYDINMVSSGEAYARNVIHHEFDHVLEYNAFGGYSWNDKAWQRCNPFGFTYGHGGSEMYANSRYANTAHPRAGFITGYATSGIEEDKAEVFAELLTGRYDIDKATVTDPNLACKVALYKSYLGSLGFNL